MVSGGRLGVRTGVFFWYGGDLAAGYPLMNKFHNVFRKISLNNRGDMHPKLRYTFYEIEYFLTQLQENLIFE